MKLFLTIQSILIFILISSCTPIPIAIPLFPEEPLQNEELQFLKPEETTLAEIKDHLWEPLAIRNNGKLLLYKEHRTSWVAWVGPGFMELRIIAFLFIEMNEDNKLKRYEVITNHEGFFHEIKDCTSWGLCLDMEMLQFQNSDSLIDDATYVLLGPKIEQSELEHPPDGQCQIISYLGNKSKFVSLRVQIDENPKRAISKKGFLKNVVAPGDHSFTVDWPLEFGKAYKTKEIPIRQNLFCNSGESLFVSVFTSGGIIRFHKVNMEIKSTAEGLEAVKERHLIID
ncbi:hypothetical protein ACFLZ5_11490 [Thermodesulfobacteriota bacterium]